MTVVLARRCDAFLADGRCDGRVLATFELGDLLHGECPKCGAQFAVPCLKVNPELRRQRRLETAQLPPRFAGSPFEPADCNREALAAVRLWLAGLRRDDDGRLAGALPAPALWGDAGRGKTHLLVATCRRLIDQHDASVGFWAVRGLLRALQQFETDERHTAWERATSVDVLALDDVGAMQQTDWRHDQLADLIDERYQGDKPVLVATNYPPSTWPDMLDARTASRLAGMTFAVQLGGPDRRFSERGDTQ